MSCAAHPAAIFLPVPTLPVKEILSTPALVRELLTKQGYTRIRTARDQLLEVIQDRVRAVHENASRFVEAVARKI